MRCLYVTLDAMVSQREACCFGPGSILPSNPERSHAMLIVLEAVTPPDVTLPGNEGLPLPSGLKARTCYELGRS